MNAEEREEVLALAERVARLPGMPLAAVTLAKKVMAVLGEEAVATASPVKDVVDSTGGVPVYPVVELGRSEEGLPTFRACLRGKTFDTVSLLQVVGHLLKVQVKREGRPGLISVVTVAAVHPEDRPAVEKLMRESPGGETQLFFDDNDVLPWMHQQRPDADGYDPANAEFK